jgi:hypothetical protein
VLSAARHVRAVPRSSRPYATLDAIIDGLYATAGAEVHSGIATP